LEIKPDENPRDELISGSHLLVFTVIGWGYNGQGQANVPGRETLEANLANAVKELRQQVKLLRDQNRQLKMRLEHLEKQLGRGNR